MRCHGVELSRSGALRIDKLLTEVQGVCDVLRFTTEVEDVLSALKELKTAIVNLCTKEVRDAASVAAGAIERVTNQDLGRRAQAAAAELVAMLSGIGGSLDKCICFDSSSASQNSHYE